MIELLRSGAPATMPLLAHLLRAKLSAAASGGGAPPSPPQQAVAGRIDQLQEGQPLQPDSPCYSCTDDEDAGGPATACGTADGLAESPLLQAERICRRFGLNQEQAEVLQYVASWCQPGSASAGGGVVTAQGGAAAQAPPPICLVHGPFGSGEAHTQCRPTSCLLTCSNLPCCACTGAVSTSSQTFLHRAVRAAMLV